MSTISIPRTWIWQPTLFVVLFFLGLRIASSGTATLSFVLLAVYALIGRRQAIHALFLSWLFVMLNPAIAPSPSATSLLRYLILFSAAASVAMRSNLFHGRVRVPKLNFLTIALGLFIIVHSLVISPEPVVSVLKGVSWMLAILTSIAAWSGLSPEDRNQTASEIFMGLVFVAIACLPFMSTSYAYISGQFLFRGVLGHSQALGPMLAILAAWITALYLQRAGSLRIMLLALILPLIFLTGARTALLSGLLGVIMATLITPWLSRRRLRDVVPALKGGAPFVMAMIALLLAIIWMDTLLFQLDSFLNKGRQFDSIAEAYEDSRGGLISAMLVNISEYPLTGIGFGIASDPESMVVERIAGIPVSAVVEKGVTPIAILEELGIPGAALAALWLWSLIVSGARKGLEPLSVLFTIIALNLGEATLFSPGGMGMLSIVLIGWTVSSARSHSKWNTIR